MSVLRRREVLLGLAALPFAGEAQAKQRKWLLLGTAVLRRMQESIEIRITAWHRSFSHIKLGVRKDDAYLIRGVRMKTLTVIFGDGGRATRQIQAVVETGGTTPPFKLSERKRLIRHVHLTYALAPTRRFVDREARGTVEVWGRR